MFISVVVSGVVSMSIGGEDASLQPNRQIEQTTKTAIAFIKWRAYRPCKHFAWAQVKIHENTLAFERTFVIIDQITAKPVELREGPSVFFES